jgi:hypothetical protein
MVGDSIINISLNFCKYCLCTFILEFFDLFNDDIQYVLTACPCMFYFTRTANTFSVKFDIEMIDHEWDILQHRYIYIYIWWIYCFYYRIHMPAIIVLHMRNRFNIVKSKKSNGLMNENVTFPIMTRKPEYSWMNVINYENDNE